MTKLAALGPGQESDPCDPCDPCDPPPIRGVTLANLGNIWAVLWSVSTFFFVLFLWCSLPSNPPPPPKLGSWELAATATPCG